MLLQLIGNGYGIYANEQGTTQIQIDTMRNNGILVINYYQIGNQNIYLGELK